MPPGRPDLAVRGVLVAVGLAVGLVACSLPTPPAPPAARYAVHQGAGWTMRVPEGARVAVDDRTIAVDAPDGTWWYDVRWHEGGPSFLPQVAAHAWAGERCAPFRFDQPVAPIDGVWTVGGTCSIGEGRFWIEVIVVEDGSRARFVGLTGMFGRVHYEDLWVHLFATALSLRAGGEPASDASLPAVRETVRGTRFDDPRNLLPVPGGGVFSGEVSRALGPAWPAWRDAAVPARFDRVEDPTPAAPEAPAP